MTDEKKIKLIECPRDAMQEPPQTLPFRQAGPPKEGLKYLKVSNMT